MKFAATLAVATLLGIASCDDGGESSYSVLPYGRDNGAPSISYGAPSTGYGAPSNNYGPSPYYSYGNDQNKKGDKMQKFFKKQFDNVKGYGKRMQNFFDDKKSKFLEFHGSLMRAKGSFLKSHGENMLRKAYQMRIKGNSYPQQHYYQAPSYNTYQAPSYVQHDSGYHAPSKGHATHGKSAHHSKGHHSKGGEGFGHPKGKDIIHHSKATQPISTGYSSPHNRISRDYSPNHVAKGVNHKGAIPVPVSFQVRPSNLVIPSIHRGYH